MSAAECGTVADDDVDDDDDGDGVVDAPAVVCVVSTAQASR